MSNYNNSNRSGGSRRFTSGDFQRRDSSRREMFKAVCDNCGRDCEVPFRPSGDKPVYCNECFGKRNGGDPSRSSGRSSDRNDYRQGDDSSRKLLEQVNSLNSKLDKVLMMLQVSVETKSVPEEKPVKKAEVKASKVVKAKAKKTSKKKAKKAASEK